MLSPTSAQGWNRPAEEVVELPSGNSARLRRPQITAMMSRGEIPNPLMRTAMSAIEGEVSRAEVDPMEAIEFMGFIVASAFVEPRVFWGEENEWDALPERESMLRFDRDLSDEDIMFVLGWWQEGSNDLAPFLEQPSGDPDGGGSGEVSHAPLVAAGDH